MFVEVNIMPKTTLKNTQVSKFSVTKGGPPIDISPLGTPSPPVPGVSASPGECLLG